MLMGEGGGGILPLISMAYQAHILLILDGYSDHVERKTGPLWKKSQICDCSQYKSEK